MSARKAGAMAAYFAASFVVLCVVFPVWDRFEYIVHESTIVSVGRYLAMTALVTLIALVLVPDLTFWMKHLPMWVSITTRTGLTFIALTVGAFYAGTTPGMINRFPVHVIGTFFAEWNFIIFIALYATTTSLLATRYYWWLATQSPIRRVHRRRPINPLVTQQADSELLSDRREVSGDR